MLKNSTRRWLAGLGVAGALVAASATPAAADSGELRVLAQDLLVAPDHSAFGYLHLTFNGDTPQNQKVTLDLDLSKLTELATFDLDGGGWACDQTATSVHCEAGLDESDPLPAFSYAVTAKAEANPGDRADLPITATFAGQKATRTIAVIVAEGVDLQSEPEMAVTADPGATVGLPGAVTNSSETTSRGAVLVLQTDWSTPYVGNFRNCTYGDGLPAICKFNADLEPGKSYKLSKPLPVSVDDEARTGSVIVNYQDWWTKDDWALVESHPLSQLPPGKPGTGEELRLVEQTARSTAPQTDIEKWNSYTAVGITVTGDNPADLATTGSTATGKAGDTVRVTAEVKNLGPALIETWRIDGPLVRIGVPEGTTAVEVPEECAAMTPDGEWNPWGIWGEPGGREYGCVGNSDIAKGESLPFQFALKIDRLTDETSGAVTVKLAGDPNPANDTAKITVKLGAGNGGDGDGQGGGDGGSLPITGASTGLIAGLGALLLAAGVGGYLVAKRRRTRFVA